MMDEQVFLFLIVNKIKCKIIVSGPLHNRILTRMLLRRSLHLRAYSSQLSSKPPLAGASWTLKLPPVSSREILRELWPLVWPKKDWRSRAKL